MNIERDLIPVMTLQEFAEKHDLVMEIHERPTALDSTSRYYAHFKHADIDGDGVLIGAYGNGETEYVAMRDYAKRIELTRLVIDAGTPNRRQINVPRLVIA